MNIPTYCGTALHHQLGNYNDLKLSFPRGMILFTIFRHDKANLSLRPLQQYFPYTPLNPIFCSLILKCRKTHLSHS